MSGQPLFVSNRAVTLTRQLLTELLFREKTLKWVPEKPVWEDEEVILTFPLSGCQLS